MRSRYKGGAGRAAALAALGVSGALLAQSLNPQPPIAHSPNPQSPNLLRSGNYEFLTTAELAPQAVAALSPDMLARLRQPQMHLACIADSDVTQAKALSGQPNDPTCRVSEQSSSGNEMRFVMRCGHSTLRFDGLFAMNSYHATVLMTSDQGQTTTLHLSAQRVGNCTR